jgi:hypothetical protein
MPEMMGKTPYCNSFNSLFKINGRTVDVNPYNKYVQSIYNSVILIRMTSLANNTYELNAGLMNITVATASNLCSLLTLWIIYKCQRWNAYVQIILSMTVSQLLYDTSFYFLLNGSDTSFYIQEFLSSFAGAATTLWTNVMSGVVLYLVTTRKSMDIESMYVYFFSGIVVVSLLLATMTCVYLTDSIQRDYAYGFYMVFRGLSICFNIISYLFISRNLNEIGSSSRYASTRAPLQTLAARMKYYPIVQILSRAWPTYYEVTYGFSKLHNKVYATNNALEIASLYLFAIFLPIAGIGYFIVFLAMQPLAWYNLKFMFGCAKPTKNNSQRRGVSYTYTALGQSDLSAHQFALLEEEISNIESVDHSLPATEQYSLADSGPNNFESRSTISTHHLVSTGTRQQLQSYDDMDERELFRQLRTIDSASTRTASSDVSSNGNAIHSRFLHVDTGGSTATTNSHVNNSAYDSSMKGSVGGSRGKSVASSRT